MFDAGYMLRSFLKIPETNVLIVNSQLNGQKDNVIYYYDMNSLDSDIINVIQPSFTIYDISYNYKLDKILAVSYDRLVIANPYTLKSEKYINMPSLVHAQMMDRTEYAIATLQQYVISIIDTNTMTIVKTLNNSKFPNALKSINYYTKSFRNQNSLYLLITVNSYGFFSWTVDLNPENKQYLENIKATYNGYIEATVVNNTDYAYRQFVKHPTRDIFFVAGANLEIIAFEIINTIPQTWRTWMKLNLYNSQYKLNATNILYKNSTIKTLNPLLLVGDGKYIYELELVYDDVNRLITIPKYKSPLYINDQYSTTNITWYEIEGTQQIAMGGINVQQTTTLNVSQHYITLYNYYQRQFTYQLFFGNEFKSKRFLYEGNEVAFYGILRAKSIQYLSNIYQMTQIGFSSNLAFKPYQEDNNFFRVKNCEECFIIKTAENATNNHFMSQVLVYPMINKQNSSLNISSLGFSWNTVSFNLDPFSYNNQTWVAFGFRNKSQDQKYLFALINMHNITQNINLYGSTNEQNNRKSSYAIASVDDPDNLEIIGIDLLGYIYVWDFLQPQFLKYSRKPGYVCLNSDIGTVYQYQKKKWFIFVCDDMKVLSYDFQQDTTQIIRYVVANPLSLRAFTRAGIITIGDTQTGNAYIYKFNNSQFTEFLTINSGTFKDSVISIELFKNNTIWVQYYYGNLFYNLGDCIDNVKDCQICQQTQFFNINRQTDSQFTYGSGSLTGPYTSEYNILTSMLKAQRYQNRISGTVGMDVTMIIDPSNTIKNPIKLPKGYLTFDFSPIIQLTIKSKILEQFEDQQKYITIDYDEKLQISNYNYVSLQNISIQFINTKECGINFVNITQNATLNDIQLINQGSNKTLNCFQISASQTNLQILNFQINNQDFSEHESIFSTIQSNWIDIKNLSLNNCVLGDGFSIVTQNTDLDASLQSISIINNSCNQNSNDRVTSLFSAGLFSVEDLWIEGNNFCNKIIFSSVPLLQHQEQKFQFKQVSILDNSFIAKTSYLFFNSFYSMKQNPSHSVLFLSVIAKNNKLLKINEDDLINASLIQTSKINYHKFEDIVFQNHYEISFSQIEYSNLVEVNRFHCINDQKYIGQFFDSKSGSCLQLFEVLSTQIYTIRIRFKKSFNRELIILQNKLQSKRSYFGILDGEFSNMMLAQYSINSLANPITISSQNELILNFFNCHFYQNNLKIIEGSQTFSSSALWVENSLGTVQIKNSTFKNSSSNSTFSFIFIQTEKLQLDNLIFEHSQFQLDDTKQLGGCMNLMVKTLNIFNSSFSKAKSQYGSFIYLQSFGSLLQINIDRTIFREGFAQIDGGALYIDIKKSILNFNCNDCIFENIYTFNQGSSTIGFEKYVITSENLIHTMSYQGGYIKNIFGVRDNFFTNVQNMKLSFINIKEIKPLPPPLVKSDDFMNQQFGQSASQQSTLICSEYSEIYIEGCNIIDISILNKDSDLPLLIDTQFTSVHITDTTIQDGIFVRSAIKVINGTLFMKNTQFTNIKQLKNLNFRQLKFQDQRLDNGISSLIVMMDSGLIVREGTSFQGIKCFNNCTGAVFYLSNSTFNISDINISRSEAAFGGSIFIQGLHYMNEIVSSKYINNIAQIDGGAIYLQALQGDVFSLKIQGCYIDQNNAVSGKGGALFIRSYSQNSTNQLIEIKDTQLIGNGAQIGGAIYQKEISPIILGTTIFQKNVGRTFGNDILSYPTHLRLSSLNEFQNLFSIKTLNNETIIISNFRSGDTLKNLSFELLNDQDEVIRPTNQQEISDFSVKVQVSRKQNFQNYSIRGEVNAFYNIKAQQFVFQDFDFIGIPGTQATLEFISNQIYVLDKNIVNHFHQDYSFKLAVDFRDCAKGEIPQVYNQLTECVICQTGKYSFDLQECHTCPSGATCEGGAQITANQGFWRKNNESRELVSCPLSENCQGGSFGNHICYEGHIGALCEECDVTGMFWKDSYTKASKSSCSNCNEISHNLYIVILVSLWTLFSIVLAVKGDIQAKLQDGTQHAFNLRKQYRQQLTSSNLLSPSLTSQQNSLRPVKYFASMSQQFKISINQNISRIDTSNSQFKSRNVSFANEGTQSKNQVPLKKFHKKSSLLEERSGVYIKILTNYFQIVSSIASFNLSIPSGIFEVPQTVGQPLGQTLNSLDCILKNYETSIPFIYLRLIISLLIPVIYFFIFFVAIGILWLCNRKGRFPWYILSTAAMFMLIYFQPDLVSQMIALISCRTIGDTKYILANVSKECYTKEHSKYVLFLVSPLLTIWTAVLPLILFIMLYKNRKNLCTLKINLKYGFLYKEYKQKAFYWEFVKMTEKIFIILSLNFYSTTIIVKATLVFIIIVIYGILCITIKPFEEQSINQLDFYSTNICALTVLLGLFIYQNPFSYFQFSSLGVILLINFIFIIGMLNKIVSIYFKQIQKIFKEKLRSFVMKIPRLRSYLSKQKVVESKKVNPIAKEKIKKIFLNFLSKSDEDKQKVRIRILKSQFKDALTSMFGDQFNDTVDSDKQQKYVPLQLKKFSTLNTEEQNNLLTSNYNLSPKMSPDLKKFKNDKISEREENKKRRTHARNFILGKFQYQEEIINSEQISEECEINDEVIKGELNNTKNQQINKFQNSFNIHMTEEGLIQFSEEQNNNGNNLTSQKQNLGNLISFNSQFQKSKINYDSENQKKSSQTKKLKFDDCIVKNDSIQSKEEQEEQCNIDNRQYKIKFNNNLKNQPTNIIKLQQSQNNELEYLDENQDKEIFQKIQIEKQQKTDSQIIEDKENKMHLQEPVIIEEQIDIQRDTLIQFSFASEDEL